VRIGFEWTTLTEGDHLADPGTQGRIIIKRIFEKVAGSCDCGNETSGSIKCGKFLD
jgi:hypothetical protein